MKSRLSTILIILWLLLPVAATAQGSLEEASQQAYSSGQYREAAALLERLISEYPTGEAYFNLASAYLQLDEEGLALANYLRAQHLIPRSEEVNRQIDRLRANTVLSPYQWDTLTQIRLLLIRWLSWEEQKWIFTGCWSSFFLLLGLRIFGIRNKTIHSLLMILLLGTILSALAVGLRYVTEQTGQWAVVKDPSVTVYSGPAEDYLPLYTLYQLDEIIIVEIKENWARFYTRGSRVGWIPISASVEVLPAGRGSLP